MKKIIKFLSMFLLTVVALLAIIVMSSFLNTGQLGRFIIYNYADIMDYEKFPSRTLESSTSPFRFLPATKEKGPKALKTGSGKIPFDDYLEYQNTVAFMIIKNDTVQYERYFDGYDQSSIVPSFSMAKSVYFHPDWLCFGRRSDPVHRGAHYQLPPRIEEERL